MEESLKKSILVRVIHFLGVILRRWKNSVNMRVFAFTLFYNEPFHAVNFLNS